jgi:hypothetical protein
MPVLSSYYPENGTLRPRQEAAALSLARGSTIQEAASGSGTCERTVKLWLTKSYFRLRVSELRGQLTESALGQLVNALGQASDTLVGLLSHPSGSIRLGAARSIIELSSRLRETTELEQRIANLEEHLHAQSTRPA